MAIRDIFWACPLCRRKGALRREARRRERCSACGALFWRGHRSTVTASRDDQSLTRSVADWLRDLGEPDVAPLSAGVLLGPERVTARVASEQRPLRFGGEILGWIEVFGPETGGDLELTAENLTFRAHAEGGLSFSWPLDTLTVVQPSSSSLQVAVGNTVASLAFPDSSLRLWSRTITTTLRRHYAARGRDVIEFQPQIRSRPAPSQGSP